MTLKMAILAGGTAQRLRPVTEKIPKALIEIKNKLFIDWQLDLLSRKGISDVVLCVSYRADLIMEHVGNGSKFNINVTYSEDGDELLGTGGAIKKAIPLLGEKFSVIYGDSYLDIDYQEAESTFENCGQPAMMTVYKNNGLHDQSNIKFIAPNVEEYCKNSNKNQFEYIDFGLNFFKKEIFDKEEYGRKFDLGVVCQDLAMDKKLAGLEVNKRFYEVGSFNGILDFCEYLEREDNVIH
jgi:NDP-sugar pyrophosphorylase family protein